MDPYEVLGVPRDADDKAIRHAYRRAAMASHPDREGGSDEAAQVVNEAYEILKDPARREAYDMIPSPVETRLIELFLSIINSDEFDGDIIDTCRAKVRAVIDQHTSQRMSLTRQLMKMERQSNRIVANGRNFYQQVLNTRLTELKTSIKAGGEEIDLLEEVLELLAEYADSNPITSTAVWPTIGPSSMPRFIVKMDVDL